MRKPDCFAKAKGLFEALRINFADARMDRHPLALSDGISSAPFDGLSRDVECLNLLGAASTRTGRSAQTEYIEVRNEQNPQPLH